jgi:integrase
MRWDWTDRNPAASAKPPTPSRQAILATSPEDVAKVIAEARARSTALGLYLWLVVVTGVRRGELCGLQIRDIDLDRALVHIAFNYIVRGGRRVRKDTKTHQDRWHAIDPVTCALIAGYLAEIKAELAAVGAGLRDDAYLFSNDPAHTRGRGTRTGSRTGSPRSRPEWNSTSRAAGITPRASSWPAGSTCGTLPHGSATAAAARPPSWVAAPGRSPAGLRAPPAHYARSRGAWLSCICVRTGRQRARGLGARCRGADRGR